MEQEAELQRLQVGFQMESLALLFTEGRLWNKTPPPDHVSVPETPSHRYDSNHTETRESRQTPLVCPQNHGDFQICMNLLAAYHS